MRTTWAWAALAAVTMLACQSGNAPDEPATASAAERNEPPAQPRPSTPEPAAMPPTDVLALELPAIEKGPNWQSSVPAPNPFPAEFDAAKDYFATLHTTQGDITVKFFPDGAPRHVTSFIYLSKIGFYDDSPFHRVCKDFMMQGGDPTGTGSGGPGYSVPAEFNPRKHVKGILSMARTADPNGAGSQFFLMFTSFPGLDNQYTVFGEVVEGMDVVDRFHNDVAVPSRPDMSCPPRSMEKIKSVTIFTRDKA